ncbi:MAG TPA: hypothetical protein VGA59_04560 [Ramlibacter sp.]|jgi:hypothetical protein
MSTLTKIAGVLSGISAVAVIGVAVAQSEPPNPLIPHHAIAAGQQSTHITPMGETGVLAPLGELRTATITREAEVAVVAPAPAPVVEAPAPVVAAPEPPATVVMAAAPEPMQPEPEPMRPRQDRN